MVTSGKFDVLEDEYTAKFHNIISKFGLVLEYKRDRAAIDMGLHFYELEPSLQKQGDRILSQVRVWFQFKGRYTEKLTREKFEKEKNISYPKVSVEQVKFWYASPEPIYFTVYIKCIDSFFCEDIQDIVNRNWGEAILNPATLGSQKTVTLKLEKNSFLNEERLKNIMNKHRSLRIDCPSFRGRPLGHRIDPLRSTLKEMKPDVFQTLIMCLLKEHNYEIEEATDEVDLSTSSSGDIAKILYGTMHSNYEWVYQITTPFVTDSKFRSEGQSNFIQGKCAVLIYSKIVEEPDLQKLKQIIDIISKKNIENFLVFVNVDLNEKNEYIGNFSTAYREANIMLKHRPLGLDEICFNVLTCTQVYLDFRDKLDFKSKNYLWN